MPTGSGTPPSPALSPLSFYAVEERLGFAEKRANELFALNGGDLIHAESSPRQQLVQEFFFHLLGAIDVFAQFVNEQRGLGHDPQDVSIGYLHDKITPTTDPLDRALRELYVNPKRSPLPSDPYSDDGYLYRAYNYRHHVTHRRMNPWLFRMGSVPPVSFILDPRVHPGNGPNHSVLSYDDEMQAMLDLVDKRVRAAKAAI